MQLITSTTSVKRPFTRWCWVIRSSFTRWCWVIRYSTVFFPHLFQKRIFGITGTAFFTGQMPFPPPSQTVSKHWRELKPMKQPQKITHWPHAFFIYHQTLERRGLASMMLALQCQYNWLLLLLLLHPYNSLFPGQQDNLSKLAPER